MKKVLQVRSDGTVDCRPNPLVAGVGNRSTPKALIKLRLNSTLRGPCSLMRGASPRWV